MSDTQHSDHLTEKALSRLKAPPAHFVDQLPYMEPRRFSLSNGLPVYVLEGGEDAIMKVELVFFAGSFHQTQPLIAWATANMLKQGTQRHTAAEISEWLDFYGAHFQADPQKDIVSVSLFMLNEHAVPLMDMFGEIITGPVFPEDELKTMLKNQKQQHLVNARKVEHLARTYFAELLYGNEHPYGYRIQPDDFDKPRADQLRDFYQKYLHPGNAVCIVSGRPPKDFDQLLEKHLGGESWEKGPDIHTPVYAWNSSPEKKVLVDKPDALQSAVRIGRRLVSRTHPDYHGLLITNALFGGYFGSRLMQNIRQDKGYTYGIHSSLVSLLRDGYFFISTQVGVDVCAPAVEQIYHELRRLRSEAAGQEELDTLKAYLSGNFLRSFDGPFSQAERFKEVLAFHMDFSHYDHFLDTLQGFTPDHIMTIARRYLHEDAMIELVVGRK